MSRLYNSDFGEASHGQEAPQGHYVDGNNKKMVSANTSTEDVHEHAACNKRTASLYIKKRMNNTNTLIDLATSAIQCKKKLIASKTELADTLASMMEEGRDDLIEGAFSDIFEGDAPESVAALEEAAIWTSENMSFVRRLPGIKKSYSAHLIALPIIGLYQTSTLSAVTADTLEGILSASDQIYGSEKVIAIPKLFDLETTLGATWSDRRQLLQHLVSFESGQPEQYARPPRYEIAIKYPEKPQQDDEAYDIRYLIGALIRPASPHPPLDFDISRPVFQPRIDPNVIQSEVGNALFAEQDDNLASAMYAGAYDYAVTSSKVSYEEYRFYFDLEQSVHQYPDEPHTLYISKTPDGDGLFGNNEKITAVIRNEQHQIRAKAYLNTDLNHNDGQWDFEGDLRDWNMATMLEEFQARWGISEIRFI